MAITSPTLPGDRRSPRASYCSIFDIYLVCFIYAFGFTKYGKFSWSTCTALTLTLRLCPPLPIFTYFSAFIHLILRLLVISDYRDTNAARPEAAMMLALKQSGVDEDIVTFPHTAYEPDFTQDGINIYYNHPRK